jgi:methylenetetrahydrofolate dehydrogenase (NADP+)/methenyltetrahydrofolate cyclohydrolase
MEPIILDGKKCADHTQNIIKENIIDLGLNPSLAILTFGDNDASKVYVRNKLKAAEKVGIQAEHHTFDQSDYNASTFERDISEIVAGVSGVILQLPVPEWCDEKRILSLIPPEKDVDGLTETQMGRLRNCPSKNLFIPCTPSGIILLLGHYLPDYDLAGKHAVVVGRSNLVGRPMAEILLSNDMTVTLCHSKTKDLASFTKQADILVSAAGRRNLITADMVKEGAIVIDVSINRDEEGKLCGDVDFKNVAPKCYAITPVPGGVGPMTVTALMQNTFFAEMDHNS